MCEVRRVFHNVNSNNIIPLSHTKNSTVRIHDPIVSKETSNKFLKNKKKEQDHLKENGFVNSIDNSQEKKCQKSVQNDFSEPKLLTSLKIIESLKNIGNDKKPKKLVKNNFLPESNGLKQKASRKVNIPFEEKVYKGLIELQVTDEDIGLYPKVPLKPKELTKNKEPEPLLSDFYKPKFDKEYIVKPAVSNFEINPVIIIDIPSVLAATKKWEPD